jgi:hypothetical protein
MALPTRDGGRGRHRRGGTVIPPPPVGELLCRGGGDGRRGRLRLDLGARTRVGGGVRALWFPAPDAPVDSDAVADADPAVGAATASRAERFSPSCCEGGSTVITAKTLPSGTVAVFHCVMDYPAL